MSNLQLPKLINALYSKGLPFANRSQILPGSSSTPYESPELVSSPMGIVDWYSTGDGSLSVISFLNDVPTGAEMILYTYAGEQVPITITNSELISSSGGVNFYTCIGTPNLTNLDPEEMTGTAYFSMSGGVAPTGTSIVGGIFIANPGSTGTAPEGFLFGSVSQGDTMRYLRTDGSSGDVTIQAMDLINGNGLIFLNTITLDQDLGLQNSDILYNTTTSGEGIPNYNAPSGPTVYGSINGYDPVNKYLSGSVIDGQIQTGSIITVFDNASTGFTNIGSFTVVEVVSIPYAPGIYTAGCTGDVAVPDAFQSMIFTVDGATGQTESQGVGVSFLQVSSNRGIVSMLGEFFPGDTVEWYDLLGSTGSTVVSNVFGGAIGQSGNGLFFDVIFEDAYDNGGGLTVFRKTGTSSGGGGSSIFSHFIRQAQRAHARF